MWPVALLSSGTDDALLPSGDTGALLLCTQQGSMNVHLTGRHNEQWKRHLSPTEGELSNASATFILHRTSKHKCQKKKATLKAWRIHKEALCLCLIQLNHLKVSFKMDT